MSLMFGGLPVTEPVPIDDDYCSGLAFIEDLGGCARFILVSRQTIFEGNDASVCVIRRKIVLPFEAIGPGVDMTLRYLGGRAARVLGGKVLALR